MEEWQIHVDISYFLYIKMEEWQIHVDISYFLYIKMEEWQIHVDISYFFLYIYVSFMSFFLSLK